ncbi:MAG: hypothetical protein WD534_10670 [Phycisphaeraceae bacterium]
MRQRRLNNGRRAGFATFVTVAMLIFVAMAVMTMTRLTAMEASRTQRVKAEAQRRQLLLAGAAAARARLAGEPGYAGTFTLDLPESGGEAERLAGAVVTVAVTAEGEQRRIASVTVEQGGQRLAQTIAWARGEGDWSPTSVAAERLR